MNKIKNPFGITKTGEIINIQNRNNNEIEKYNNCYCYYCGEKLIPKMGNVRQWHFSHKVVSKKCNASIETWLHKYAKQLIEKSNYIVIPELFASEYINQKETSDFMDKSRLFESFKTHYKTIAVEKYINNLKPDVIIQLDNGIKIAVEVVVTHEVDKNKEIKVKNNNLDMIEIYLDDNELIDEHNRDYLDNYILYNSYRKWIYKSPNYKLDNKIKKLKRIMQEEENRIKQEELKKKKQAEDNIIRINAEMEKIREKYETERRREQELLERMKTDPFAEMTIRNILKESLKEKNNRNLKLKKLFRFCHNIVGGKKYGEKIINKIYSESNDRELMKIIQEYWNICEIEARPKSY